jgi:CMP-N-acetylneuraminic acid synthetase
MIDQGMVAFVFARGGSKGLPGKNLRQLAGIPLVGHAIRTALATRGVTRCVVSTDDAEIAAVARSFGAETPFMRPPELATDRASEWAAWQHAIRSVEAQGGPIGLFLSVPPTAPLRTVGDVQACLDAFGRGGSDIVVTVTEAHRNPYFNMVTLSEDGEAERVMRPDSEATGRQSAPVVYDMTTVAYVADPAFVMRSKGVFDGRVRAVVVPAERAVDIDSELDLRLAELLIAERAARQDQ